MFKCNTVHCTYTCTRSCVVRSPRVVQHVSALGGHLPEAASGAGERARGGHWADGARALRPCTRRARRRVLLAVHFARHHAGGRLQLPLSAAHRRRTRAHTC